MKYQPITCVWEVTMGCNMRCGHCGSSCAEALPDELTTKEALALCDQIADLGLKWITLSGGEPLTRKDLPLLVERLHERGVIVNIITNGWLMTKKMVEQLKDNITTVAISIDGTQQIHDKIRRDGAFAHAREAFAALKAAGIQTGAVTTITKQNLDCLEDLKKDLIAIGVDSWQVQLGLPMGNLKQQEDWVLNPEDVSQIIDFCYQTALEGEIRIFPADCIGYYTKKEMETKRISYCSDEVSLWDGCNAGLRSFGILQNGDILGCTSIRSEKYIEGSIREHSLRRIWEDENNFLWRRNLTRDGLTDDCKRCVYVDKCLGGCPNTRLTMNGTMDSENQYCAYNLALKSMREKYSQISDADVLFSFAQELIWQGDFQEAEMALERAVSISPEHGGAWKGLGYSEYMCGNYAASLKSNQKAMDLDSEDAGALQGYSCALHRLGCTEQGIEYLKKALDTTGYQDADMKLDLEIMEKSLVEGGV